MLHCLIPFSPWRNLEDTRRHVVKTSHSRWRFSRTQAVPFSGLEDPGSPSERIASSFTGTASRLTWRPCQVHRETEYYTDIWLDVRYEMIWHDFQWYDYVPIAWTRFRVFCSTWKIHNRVNFVQKMTSSLWIVLDFLRLKVMCCDPSLSLNGFHQSTDWATYSYHTYSRQWPMIPIMTNWNCENSYV